MATGNSTLIVRHPVGERVTHWAVAFVFVFLFLSGLAMFHPFFFWLSLLLGSGQLMRKAHHPEDTGKYNGGQKLMFWSMVPIIALLLVTGIVIWQPWFAPLFPGVLRRVAGLLHAVTAFVMFVGIGIH